MKFPPPQDGQRREASHGYVVGDLVIIRRAGVTRVAVIVDGLTEMRVTCSPRKKFVLPLRYHEHGTDTWHPAEVEPKSILGKAAASPEIPRGKIAAARLSLDRLRAGQAAAEGNRAAS